MKQKLPKRSEINVLHSWDFTHLFKDEDTYLKAFDAVEIKIERFCQTYENNLKTKEMIDEALTAYQDIQADLTRLGSYSSLQASVDSLSEENQIRQGKAMMRMQIIAKKMAFFTNELLVTPD